MKAFAAVIILAVLGTSAIRAQTRPAVIDRQKLEQLDKRASEFLKEGRLDQAEDVLAECLSIAPRYDRSLYNMARLKARRGRNEAAMDYLARAAEEGFTDFIHIQNDPDLRALRPLDRYKELIARKDQIQRADADRTLVILKHQFGDGYLYEVAEAHKLVFAANTDRVTLDALKRLLAMQIESVCTQLFDRRPDQYIIVILPTPQRFAAMSRPGVGGAYDHNTHILVVGRLGQLVTHEFTHALHNADLDGTDQEHATWICEGLATMYEGGRFENGRLIPADNFRLGDLQREARESGLIPLDRLLQFDQAAFNRAATKAYGQSGSLMLYLYENGLLPKFYQAYKSDYQKDKTGRLALEEVTGIRLDELERRWKQWMLSRKPPMRQVDPGGPVLGLRFGEAHDGLPIAAVQSGSAAARAGLKAGDVIVGCDDVDVRDANTLVPMLNAHRPGDGVVLRIRRAGEYAEVRVRLGGRDGG